MAVPRALPWSSARPTMACEGICAKLQLSNSVTALQPPLGHRRSRSAYTAKGGAAREGAKEANEESLNPIRKCGHIPSL
jgi:hypothetical protein